MGFEITWTKRAVLTFSNRIAYLERHWTEREILNFTKRVSEYLTTLKSEPLMHRRSAKIKHTHIGVISKQVSIIYRIKPHKNTIELIAFIDNRQGPGHNKY